MRRVLFVIGVCVLLSLFFMSPNSQGQIGVINVPPTYENVDWDISGEQRVLDVTIFDYNGAIKIFKVEVELLDGGGVVLDSFSFRQFENPGRNQTPLNTTNDMFLGDLLDLDGCSYDFVAVDWTDGFSNLRVIFTYEEVGENTIQMTCTDVENETCTIKIDLPEQILPCMVIYCVGSLGTVGLIAGMSRFTAT